MLDLCCRHAVFSDSDLGFDWEAFTPYNRTYLHLNSHENKLKQHLRADKVSFWNTLIPSLLAAQKNRTQIDSSTNPQTRDSANIHIVESEQPSMWIFIAICVGLAMMVLILLICILRLTVQLRRYTS